MAVRFTYRFETLLKLRRQREDAQKRVVAQTLRAVEAIRDRRMRLEERIEEQVSALRDLLRAGELEVDQVKWARHNVVALRRAVLEAGAEIAARSAVLARERAALAAARKETRMLNRLKERQKEAHDAQIRREEQLQTDEMNIARYIHAGWSAP